METVRATWNDEWVANRTVKTDRNRWNNSRAALWAPFGEGRKAMAANTRGSCPETKGNELAESPEQQADVWPAHPSQPQSWEFTYSRLFAEGPWSQSWWSPPFGSSSSKFQREAIVDFLVKMCLSICQWLLSKWPLFVRFAGNQDTLLYSWRDLASTFKEGASVGQMKRFVNSHKIVCWILFFQNSGWINLYWYIF